MLPRIGEKSAAIPYHCFARELMSRKISDNNINKLKLIKEFLQDEQNDGKFIRGQTQLKRKRNQSNGKQSSLKKLKITQMTEKQNESKIKRYRRQSLTAQNKTNEREKLLVNKQKQKSIFFVPDRFKINEMAQFSGRHKKTIMIKDIISSSMKINNQINNINSHRIL